MLTLLRTNSGNIHFKNLVILLNADLQIRNGEEQAFYDKFNKSDTIKNVVICFFKNEAISCGGFKEYDNETVEIKRMFVQENCRGKAVATIVLKELESWAAELNYTNTVLETGKKQPEAIALYLKNGYAVTKNYGQYENVDNSICMMKKIKSLIDLHSIKVDV